MATIITCDACNQAIKRNDQFELPLPVVCVGRQAEWLIRKQDLCLNCVHLISSAIHSIYTKKRSVKP